MQLPLRDPFVLTVCATCVVLVPGVIGLGALLERRTGEDHDQAVSLPHDGVLLQALRRSQARLERPRLERVYAGTGQQHDRTVLAVDEVFDGDKLVQRLATVRARACSTCGNAHDWASLAAVLLPAQELQIEQVLPVSDMTAQVDVDTGVVYEELREILPAVQSTPQGGPTRDDRGNGPDRQ